MSETLSTQYNKLRAEREDYINRAEACAEVTIPKLFPKSGRSKGEDYDVPWQSVGANGVTSLASKLKQVLFPSSVPFFRLSLSQDELGKVHNDVQEMAQGDPNAFQEIFGQVSKAADDSLALYEQEAIKLMESRGDGPKQNSVFEQLIVAGNCLIKDTRISREFSVHRLDTYVVARDDTGTVLKVILKEALSKQILRDLPNLGPDMKEKLDAFFGENTNKDVETYDLYTGAILEDSGKYRVTQELMGSDQSQPLSMSETTFTPDDLPLRPLRLYDSGCEHYSRSYVENYLGDLRTLDGIYKAITEGTAAATRFIWMVRPNSQTDPEDVNKAKNGDAISGNPEDISPLSAEGKIRDISTAYQLADRIEVRLGKGFLLHSSVQRNAERVTATEVARLIQELETQLGGIYSILSQEFQRPYVWFLLSALKSLPKLTAKSVESAIITGQDALGRTEELSRIDELIQRLMAVPGAIERVKPAEYSSRVAKSLAINQASTLFYTEEEIQAKQQEAMAMQAQLDNPGQPGV
jgi:hypothetical protein